MTVYRGNPVAGSLCVPRRIAATRQVILDVYSFGYEPVARFAGAGIFVHVGPRHRHEHAEISPHDGKFEFVEGNNDIDRILGVLVDDSFADYARLLFVGLFEKPDQFVANLTVRQMPRADERFFATEVD